MQGLAKGHPMLLGIEVRKDTGQSNVAPSYPVLTPGKTTLCTHACSITKGHMGQS